MLELNESSLDRLCCIYIMLYWQCLSEYESGWGIHAFINLCYIQWMLNAKIGMNSITFKTLAVNLKVFRISFWINLGLIVNCTIGINLYMDSSGNLGRFVFSLHSSLFSNYLSIFSIFKLKSLGLSNFVKCKNVVF